MTSKSVTVSATIVVALGLAAGAILLRMWVPEGLIWALTVGRQKSQITESLGARNAIPSDGRWDVSFGGMHVDNWQVAALPGVPRLRGLDFSHARLEDPGLTFLRALPGIESLDLEGSNITREALREVAKCPLVGWLDLSGTHVDDASIAPLASLGRLYAVFLDRTTISDSGLLVLRRVKGLQQLSLGDTRVTDDGISQLVEAIPGLIYLNVQNCCVGSRTMRSVRLLTDLMDLNLEGTGVTDSDLEFLRGLHNLEVLDLYDTRVSSRAIARLRSALPKLRPDGAIRCPERPAPGKPAPGPGNAGPGRASPVRRDVFPERGRKTGQNDFSLNIGR
jgi:hypothetical protein